MTIVTKYSTIVTVTFSCLSGASAGVLGGAPRMSITEADPRTAWHAASSLSCVRGTYWLSACTARQSTVLSCSLLFTEMQGIYMYFSDINVFNVSWTNLCHICSSYQRQHNGLCHCRSAQIPLQAVACCVWTWLHPSLALSEWWFSHPMHSSMPSVWPRHPTIQVGPCTYNRDWNMLQLWPCVPQLWLNLCQSWSKTWLTCSTPAARMAQAHPLRAIHTHQQFQS